MKALEELLKDYLFSKSIGTLNPPRFKGLLGAKKMGEHICVLYEVLCGPERPYEIGDEEETYEDGLFFAVLRRFRAKKSET